MTVETVESQVATEVVVPKAIPAFEGRPVDATVVKMSGTVPVDELHDVVLSIDDIVQVRATFRVAAVGHDVDKDGNLIRVQVLKPVEAELHPFDSSDPTDEGILRAIPHAVTSRPAIGGQS